MHLAAVAVIFNRIGEEIGEHLREVVDIATTESFGEVRVDLDPTLCGRGTDEFEAIGGDQGQVARFARGRFLPGIEPGEVEQCRSDGACDAPRAGSPRRLAVFFVLTPVASPYCECARTTLTGVRSHARRRR